MLSVNKYTQEYINECRSKVSAQIKAYDNLIDAARKDTSSRESHLDSAMKAFEISFFSNMVLVLDNLFSNRSRTMEKKDGNPLNEVRLICNSILNNHGRLLPDKSIKLDTGKSVLKLRSGDEISIDEKGFVRISDAFFNEIEDKFTPLHSKRANHSGHHEMNLQVP